MQNKIWADGTEDHQEDTELESVKGTETESQDEKSVGEENQDTDSSQDVETLKAELKKERKARKDQTLRAEKAERKAKDTPRETQESKDLSSKDTIAIINAKVHTDDIDDVVEYARFKKIPIGEALKSNVVKTMLAEKEEFRTTAAATNSGKTRSGSSRPSGENLLDKARKTGELPDSDEGLDALVAARRPGKK